MNTTKTNRTIFAIVRWAILLSVLAFVSWEFIAHVYVSKVHASVHALCPLGGLESLLRWIVDDGALLQKIFSGTMGLFFVSLGTAFLFKRTFCGNICPLGTLQELSGALGNKIFRNKRIKVPVRLDRILRLLKYPILALVIAMAWITGTLWMQSFDPWPAYSHLFAPAELFPTYAIGFGVLVASLVLSFFFDRAFCKYVCPMGAVTALVGLASPFKVRREAATCTDCRLCDKACPVNIAVSASSSIADPECISCGKCAAVCPVPRTLEIGFSKKSALNPAAAVALGVGFFFLGVLALQLLGFDRKSGRQEATIREMAKQTGISTAQFKQNYGLPPQMFDGTRSSKMQDSIPFAKYAELNGTDTRTIAAMLGLSGDVNDDTPWGDVFGGVKVAKIAELNGLDFESFRRMFSLSEKINPDTPWKDVRRIVETALEKGVGNTGGSGTGQH